MSHLDDAQLDAYLAGRAEFADRASRREAGRHIADCPECRHRLRHAWAGHPESIDHPVGPASRPSWPLFRVSGPVAPPAVPPRGHDIAPTSEPSRQRRRATEVRRSQSTTEPPGAAQLVVTGTEEEGDPLSGTPWPALIAALEAVLRPKAPERATPPLPHQPTRTGGWADRRTSPFEADGGPDPELVDHSGDMPALDLDLTRRYQTRAERSRRRARRRQVVTAVVMLILAVLLAGAVLKVGAAALSSDEAWQAPPMVTPAEVPSTTLFESASALQAFAESLRAAADSFDSTSSIVASVLHPDVREAISDPTWGDSVPTVAETTAEPPREPTPAPARPEPGTARSPAAAPKGPQLPATRRASSPDAALTTGEWEVTDAVAAERLLQHRLLLVPDLGFESIARPGRSNGPFVRIAQVTKSGDRVAIVLSRSESRAGLPQAPPGLGGVRVIPATDASSTAMAMARWGEVLVTIRAELPADSLRALMGRLREVRD